MKLYTRSGDNGNASTLTRKNIPKNSPIFELLGTLDELNAQLGQAKLAAPSIRTILEQIQSDLIRVSGELSGRKKAVDRDAILQLEQAIDATSEQCEPFKDFVIPGKTAGGAALDIARTVARRAERCAVSASRTGGITKEMLAWLNRLSDLLYALARVCDCEAGITAVSAPAPQVASPEVPAPSAPIVNNGSSFCDVALRVCRAVREYAASQGVRVVTAVCDAGGNPVAMMREDDAFIASVDIAMNKAFTAVSLKMSTEELGRLSQPGQSLYGIQFTNNERLVIFGGGVPLRKNGTIVGGFGVSGGTAAQDTAFGNYAIQYFEKEMG